VAVIRNGGINVGEYYVYILSSISGVLYVGVTNDLARRVYEHKHKLIKGFTSKYNVTRLVYFEHTPDVRAAIAREKQIKGYRREKKVALIEAVNRDWKDLSEAWASDSTATTRPQRDSSLRSE
jgi:putative endonuclease